MYTKYFSTGFAIVVRRGGAIVGFSWWLNCGRCCGDGDDDSNDDHDGDQSLGRYGDDIADGDCDDGIVIENGSVGGACGLVVMVSWFSVDGYGLVVAVGGGGSDGGGGECGSDGGDGGCDDCDDNVDRAGADVIMERWWHWLWWWGDGDCGDWWGGDGDDV